MKRKVTYSKPGKATASSELKESAVAEPETMLRTQIYLSRAEHDFVEQEASRRDLPMAAVIREFIDEKMEIPDDIWMNNPMLQATVHDPQWEGREDGALNHDHYVYGSPKRWIKVKGKYLEAPALPDDYYTNRASAEAYDRKLRKLDESQ